MNLKFKQHKLLLFSLMLLTIGSLYYLLFREPIMATKLFGLDSLHLALFSPSFNSLPSFVHQLALVLLTWLVWDRSHQYFALLFWLVVNSLFELGQMVSNIDLWYLPRVLEMYLINGTYSHSDMIAIFFATFVAYIIIEKSKGKQNVYTHKTLYYA